MNNKIRAFVVDDSGFVVASVTKKLVSDPDIEVVGSARDGKEAIEKIRALKPDVITLDVVMPVMDGLTAAREIRKVERSRNIPDLKKVRIIAITANAFEDDRNKFFESGMDYYMNKPIEIEELNRILQL